MARCGGAVPGDRCDAPLPIKKTNTTGMTYSQALEYIDSSVPMFHKVGRAAYKEGLGNILELDSHLGHPHRGYATVHVAGTNGKGSCSHMLASILMAAGYRVGLFTSPHIVDFRERIRVDGRKIPQEAVAGFIGRELPFLERVSPSFFELTTAMALRHFLDERVDVAVIETGLGGRLDSTNVITPRLSVITNISLDHTGLLGGTLERIALEKAGIIKPGVPVVVGEALPETKGVFAGRAAECGSPIAFAQEERQVLSARFPAAGGIEMDTRDFGTVVTDLSGWYQVDNSNTALCAAARLRGLGFRIGTAHVQAGMASVMEGTGLMGRWQRVGENPAVVCDTGHNPGGWERISAQLRSQERERLRVVFGMVDDKDFRRVMGMLPRDATYYFTQAGTHRAIDSGRLLEAGRELGLEGSAFGDVASACRKAIGDASRDDFVFIGGSTYVVADFMADCPVPGLGAGSR